MGTTARDTASLSAMLGDSSDRTSSSCRDTVMTASNSPCTGTISRDESAHHLFFTSPSPMPEWPYARDATWVFEPPRRATSANMRSNVLQRGSSAPSRLFEECLADFHSELEVTTPRSSDPFGDGDDDLLAWADQNLAPIVERGGPQPMETEVGAAAETSSSLESCSQQFLVAQAGFERRISSISTPTQSSIGSEVVEPPAQVGGYGAVPAILENMGPSFDNQMASMLGASEEIYGGGSSSTVSSAYPAAPDHQNQISYPFGSELGPGGSGLWNPSPTPGMTFEGNRPLLRGQGNNVEPPPGWLQGSTINIVAADPAAAPLTLPGSLIRHSSLPANYVPGRAIRGHATHPRSVAERVRRGKISERMKRLQDLVPNMERQSNTADMLDEVVEYVKQLKLKVEELSHTVVQLKERAMHPD